MYWACTGEHVETVVAGDFFLRTRDDDGCGTAEQRTEKRENKSKTQTPRLALSANVARVL